jgi:hypothetical protein
MSMEVGIKAGYAQAAITPALDRPVFLAGFGHNRRAESIHDNLYARALAIGDGATTLVLCALDLIGFFRPDVYEVIQQVARPDVQIVIASTHTHHGPDTMGLWGPDARTRGVDEAWMAATRRAVAETIRSALSDLKPAAAKWTSVPIPGLAKNFRDPAITDDELSLLQFLFADGHALATLFNFACHPEVLWEMNPHVTSDYVHFLRGGSGAADGGAGALRCRRAGRHDVPQCQRSLVCRSGVHGGKRWRRRGSQPWR